MTPQRSDVEAFRQHAKTNILVSIHAVILLLQAVILGTLLPWSFKLVKKLVESSNQRVSNLDDYCPYHVGSEPGAS